MTDVLQIAEALIRLGYGQDERLLNLFQFIRGKRTAEGSWLLEYDYTGKTWVDFG